MNRSAAPSRTEARIPSQLEPIDNGRRLRATSSIRPREPDGGYPSAETVASAIADELGALIRLMPADHFVKYAKVDCDSLRDGVPKGGRYHLAVIFQPFPPKRGDKPHGETP